MAAKTFDEWWANEGSKFTNDEMDVAQAAWNAAMNTIEARPTVRAKRPVQQAKERKPNRFMGNGYYNY